MAIPPNAQEGEFVSLEERFFGQALRTPDRIAVEYGSERICYRELAARASRVALRIAEKVGESNRIVCVHTVDPLDTLIGVLGILRSGNAFFYLDPSFPRLAKAFLLEDCSPSLILTSSDDLPNLPHTAGEPLLFDGEDARADSVEEALRARRSADSISSVVYTSGSTGAPKAVLGTQAGVVAYLDALKQHYGVGESDTCINLVPPRFDSSFREIFAPLTSGGRLVLVDPDTRKSAEQALEAIARYRVTVILSMMPSRIRRFAKVAAPCCESVRLVMLCGEAFHESDFLHARRVFSKDATLVNQYGVSEVTQAATWMNVSDAMVGVETKQSRRPLPIGRPLPHIEIRLLDDQLRSVVPGAVGEIYIGGTGIARGYHNRPALDEHRFLPDPFSSVNNARMYRTGDLGRRRDDGNLEWLGRIDDQVKIGAMRIEPLEVQAAVLKHPLVADCFVTGIDSGDFGVVLAAYIVPVRGQTLSRAELLTFLADWLPKPAIPGVIVLLDELPIAENGKVDRSRLIGSKPRPEADVPEQKLPRTATQVKLASIWKDLFHLPRIAIDDDFFDLGGNSLMAVEMLTRIENVFQRSIPLQAVLSSHTVQGLAELIDGEPSPGGLGCSVGINREGSKIPIFAIGGLYGEIFRIAALGWECCPSQPFYTLYPPGMDWSLAGCGTLEQMASYYVEEILKIRPKGPYHLLGTSFGGVLAFEVAVQLQAREKTVGVLSLVDSAPLHASIAFSSDYYMPKVDGSERTTEPAVQAGLDVSWQHVKALQGYRPQRKFWGKLLYFRSSGNTIKGILPGSPEDARMRWRELATEGMDLRFIPGKHAAFHLNPQKALLVQELERAVNSYRSATARGARMLRTVSSFFTSTRRKDREALRRWLDVMQGAMGGELRKLGLHIADKEELVASGGSPTIVLLGEPTQFALSVMLAARQLEIDLVFACDLGVFDFTATGVSLRCGLQLVRDGLRRVRFREGRSVGYVLNAGNTQWNHLFSGRGVSLAFDSGFEHLARNRLVTSSLLRAEAIRVPRIHGFVFRHHVPSGFEADDDLDIVRVGKTAWPNMDISERERLEGKIGALLLADGMRDGVVVRPMIGGGNRKVRISKGGEPDRVCEAVFRLLKSGHGALLQEYVEPKPLGIEGRDSRWRVLLARGRNDRPGALAIAACGEGEAKPERLSRWACLEELGASSGLDACRREAIVSQAIKAVTALEKGCGDGALQDISGVDIVLSRDFEAVVVGVHGQRALDHFDISAVKPACALLECISRRARACVSARRQSSLCVHESRSGDLLRAETLP